MGRETFSLPGVEVGGASSSCRAADIVSSDERRGRAGDLKIEACANFVVSLGCRYLAVPSSIVVVAYGTCSGLFDKNINDLIFFLGF